jgi:transaldolase
MTNQLDQLKKFTTVVADTGDIESIQAYSPQDATTNPSLILAAAQLPQYQPLILEAIAWAKDHSKSKLEVQSVLEIALERLLIIFGCSILKLIPGRVSTEIDARLAFDTTKSIQQALRIIEMFDQEGISKERILIKLATTWEGIQTAKYLESRGIHCNLTLLFSLEQAIACAQAKVTLISPFVGRILDWYKAKGHTSILAFEDPGVISVKEIYHYFKKFGYATQVMGASFRNKEEILELAGCDLLTISPTLLSQLQQSSDPVERRIEIFKPNTSKKNDDNCELSEAEFRFVLNQNEMASDKLAEGIRKFAADTDKLERYVQLRI